MKTMRRKTTLCIPAFALALILATTTCEQLIISDIGTQDNEGAFVQVTGINGNLPDKILAGYKIDLNEYVTVKPENATYRAIIWKIADPASVGITEDASDGVFTPTTTGPMTVTATVTGGTKTGDFTAPDYTITVIGENDYVAATGITGELPERGFAGVAIDLGGVTVTPSTATYNRIVWTVTSGTITDNKLTASSTGTLTLQGSVLDPKTPRTKDFTLTIMPLSTGWTKAVGIPAQMPGEIQTVCYGNGLFVAGSRENDGRIAWSADGIHWTVINSSQTTFQDIVGQSTLRHFVHVKYLNGKFWAVGGGGHMAYSENGKTWIKVDSPGIERNIVDIAWGEVAGNGVFVAGGDRGTMSYSTDGGITWESNDQDDYFGDGIPHIANVKAIGWGGGRFLAVGQYGRAIYSADGIHWTNISSKTAGIFDSPTDHESGISIAAYSGGQYIIAGLGVIALSTDCENWEPIEMADANYNRDTKYGYINSLVYADGLYVIGGGDGKAAYSTDARHWTPITATRPIFHNFHFINGLAYDGKGTFVAVGATCADPDCSNPWDSIRENDHYGDAGCIAYIRP
jgi:hypothetical protein